jgi:hypothetical protein
LLRVALPFGAPRMIGERPYDPSGPPPEPPEWYPGPETQSPNLPPDLPYTKDKRPVEGNRPLYFDPRDAACSGLFGAFGVFTRPTSPSYDPATGSASPTGLPPCSPLTILLNEFYSSGSDEAVLCEARRPTYGAVEDHFWNDDFNECPVRWPKERDAKPPPSRVRFFQKGKELWWVKEWWGDKFGNCTMTCATPNCWKVVYMNINDPTYYRVIGLCEYDPPAQFDANAAPVRDPATGKILTFKCWNYEKDPTAYGDPSKVEWTDYEYNVKDNQITVIQSEVDRDGTKTKVGIRALGEPPLQYPLETAPGFVTYPDPPPRNR